MKTSVNMVRNMGDFNVIQRTLDGYFEANHLLSQWNLSVGNRERQMSRFVDSPKTKEFIGEIIDQERHQAKMLEGDFEVVKIMKGKYTNRGKYPDKVFMHPFLFIDFAMWLNPKFKYSVIKFVYDQLIELRHTAGDNYNVLRFKIAKEWKPKPDFYKHLNCGLNHVVFGTHKWGIRNTANEEQLGDLADLQKVFVYNINSSLIDDPDALLLELRKEYVRRHLPNHKSLNEK